METKLDHQKSLELINEMIIQTKNNFQKGSLSVVLFWGYLISSIAIINFILLQVLSNPVQSYWIWSITILGGIISFFIQRKTDRTALVKNHIDSIIKYVWFGFGISTILLIIIFWTIRLPHNIQFLYLTPIIMLTCGVAQLVTAVACRYKSYYWGAVAFWLGALLGAISTVVFKIIDYQFLIMAIAAIVSFIIPNHILNKKNKKHV